MNTTLTGLTCQMLSIKQAAAASEETTVLKYIIFSLFWLRLSECVPFFSLVFPSGIPLYFTSGSYAQDTVQKTKARPNRHIFIRKKQ